MNNDLSKSKMDAFLSNIPLLHSWDNGQTRNTGGFHRIHFRVIASVLLHHFSDARLRILETGAGNSTIFFCLQEPIKLTTIAHPNDSVIDRIREYCSKNDIDLSCLEYHSQISELMLPQLILDKEFGEVDVILIDGGHGWPTVFVDFFYCNYILKQNGLLLIDDIQLYSVKELVRFLNELPDWQVLAKMDKLWIFEKLSSDNILSGNIADLPYLDRKAKDSLATKSQWQI